MSLHPISAIKSRLFFAICVGLLSVAGLAAVQVFKVVAPDAAAQDRFGWGVAIQGRTLVASATQPGGPGVACVFVKSAGVWVQQAKLNPPDPQPDDAFGSGVAMDGDLIAIGATGDDTPGGTNAGAVYVYERNAQGVPGDVADDTWSLQATVVPSDAKPFHLFGISVALDQDTLVVGAWGDNVFGNISGSAYVFRRSGNSWVQEAKLYASDPATGDRFGVFVAVDGNWIVVGANGDSSFTGAAYVFERVGSGWIERAKLTPSAGVGSAQFGRRVTLQDDTVAVGSAQENSAAGAAYVFQRDGLSWPLRAKIVASAAAAGGQFGGSVSLRGNTLAIGALEFGTGTGAVYVFERQGTAWNEQQKLTASDAAFNDVFGFSTALDDSQLLTGAVLADAAGADSGAAYVFELRSIEDQFGSLADQVEGLVAGGALNNGQGNSLLAKLDAALLKAQSGNTTVAINQLRAFINQVEALIASGLLSAPEGNALVEAAQHLIERLQG
ncbi:MAG: FG-GAP repeat protein [Acidobacteriota bacterium]